MQLSFSFILITYDLLCISWCMKTFTAENNDNLVLYGTLFSSIVYIIRILFTVCAIYAVFNKDRFIEKTNHAKIAKTIYSYAYVMFMAIFFVKYAIFMYIRSKQSEMGIVYILVALTSPTIELVLFITLFSLTICYFEELIELKKPTLIVESCPTASTIESDNMIEMNV